MGHGQGRDRPYFEENFLQKRNQNQQVVGKNPYQEALVQVRDKLSSTYNHEELSNAGPKVVESSQQIARDIFVQYNETAIAKSKMILSMDLDAFIIRVSSDLLGMGALDSLIADESVEDIAVNGPNEVMVFRNGGWEKTDITFSSSERLLEMLNRGIAGSNKQVNTVNPIVDGLLPGKQRVSIVTHPITDTTPTAVVRIMRSSGINLGDMVVPFVDPKAGEIVKNTPLPDYASLPQGGMLSAWAASYLHAAVLAGLNIAVIGPTGVGKTTLLTALGRCIPEGNRVLIIEDTPEIVLRPGSSTPGNILSVRTRSSNIEGVQPVTQADLVKLALRQRPDALTLGEARGAEVFDLLNALKTGHKNGLTSLHAENSSEVFERIYLMLSQSERGRNLNMALAANLVATSLHIIISLELHGRERRIQSIFEFTKKVIGVGGSSPEPEMKAIFNHSGPNTGLGKPLRTSEFADKFIAAGIPNEVFSP